MPLSTARMIDQHRAVNLGMTLRHLCSAVASRQHMSLCRFVLFRFDFVLSFRLFFLGLNRQFRLLEVVGTTPPIESTTWHSRPLSSNG